MQYGIRNPTDHRRAFAITIYTYNMIFSIHMNVLTHKTQLFLNKPYLLLFFPQILKQTMRQALKQAFDAYKQWQQKILNFYFSNNNLFSQQCICFRNKTDAILSL